ncbi:MAG TPA: carboxypeptidase regulatory-like domain-containing protein [Candidatus Caldiarchaeum subterraneum]|uniref:Carboxypeptidase regulatory-like domain-containing protein n=1 Tax=Caldiarchaeum subterraneum TaxID=311458 RepID=A0A832ZU23_CALS0|nr:carboxypeptidase regulatory-like domain-containing protein [Candidatus Caldarchaeum subterraneum]
MGISRGVELVNGSSVFEDLPDASYVARGYYRGKLVLEAEVERLGGELRLVAAVARLSARVVDQFNNPVEGALVSVEDTQAVSGGDGYAVLGHLPLGEYEAQVEYRGVKAGTVRLNLTGGEAVKITIQLHTLRVEAVDEIGRPLEVSASLYSMGRLIASGSGSAIEFPKLPSGNYQLTLRRGPKEVNKPIALAGDRVETVTFPILLELGGVALSSQEAMLILLPLVAVMLLVIAGLMVREFIRWLRERE